MSKIICDICGTSYPDTEPCCPICGCTPGAVSALTGEDLLEESAGQAPDAQESPRKIFDFDEVNGDTPEDEEDYTGSAYDDEEEEEAPQHQNTLVVIALTVLIALLLMAAGFIFVKYFLPNMGSKEAETAVATETTAAASGETTELNIPCAELYIISGKTVELNEPGQMFLLHVKASPENTTDKIVYTSADESIATVTEDGKITAISEGETVISISCGVSTMECPVIIKYTQETVPPTTAAAPAQETEAPAVDEGTAPQETSAQQPANQETTPAPTAAPANKELKNVVLKLKKTDIRLGVYYEFKLLLDCDLEQNEVQWTSEHPYIASVDENGVVKALKAGTTSITAQYGDQKVQCIIRCF